jgi:arginine-tRNA-protein transferase
VEIAYRYMEPPSPCGYLPGESWQIEYVQVATLALAEYGRLLAAGWRRFGHLLFRPRCPSCRACQSLRIDPTAFRPDRSQRRARRACGGRVTLDVAAPAASREAFDLYARFHAFQAEHRGWPRGEADRGSFAEGFLRNPFPTEQWSYRLDGRLVGLGFVDAPPGVGLSAIYFVHDPAHRELSLGTWNVLSLIDEAARRGLPHLYLGFYVAGCRSLAYKARFGPHEILGPDGTWTAGEANRFGG